MKKQVMKRAWEIRRQTAKDMDVKVREVSMSECLKMAWAELKKPIEKSLKRKIVERLQFIINHSAGCWNPQNTMYFNANKWVKYGKSRTYFEICEANKYGHVEGKRTYGYLDNITGEYIVGKCDRNAFDDIDFHGGDKLNINTWRVNQIETAIKIENVKINGNKAETNLNVEILKKDDIIKLRNCYAKVETIADISAGSKRVTLISCDDVEEKFMFETNANTNRLVVPVCEISIDLLPDECL